MSKCQWDKDHGKAVIKVRYTTVGQKRTTRSLCASCADIVLGLRRCDPKIVL